MQENYSLVENNDKNLPTLPKNSNNYGLIEIDNKKYAIKANSIVEIVKVIELEKEIELPSCILGLMKFENKPIGVIDLREILSKPRKIYDLNAKILILKESDTLSAIICDKVLDIQKFDMVNINKVPYQPQDGFFDGVYDFEDENIYILNIKNLVLHIEKNIDKYPKNITENYIVCDEESKKVLSERKKFLLKNNEDISKTTPFYNMGVTFLVGNVKYYINMQSVREFYRVQNSKFIKVPNVPEYICGLMNIKSEYIAILDLRNFFNSLKTELKAKSTIIILNSDEYKIGILADEICENINIDLLQIQQNKINKTEDNIIEEFVKDNEVYQILDVDKLLQSEKLIIC